MINLLRRYPYAVFYALDILGSALTFGAPGMTISARLGKEDANGHFIGTAFSRGLDWLVLKLFRQPNHAESSFLAYKARVTAAPYYG